MRKWIKRAIQGAVGLVALLILSGLTYEQLARRSVFKRFAPLGEFVEVDGRTAHLRCLGEGRPTVVLEAGFGPDGSESWASIMPDIASISRVCAYDRAGILWSEPGKEPRDAYHIADELHALLATASESPPFVLVGHSLGGLFVRVFADRYGDEVSGVVFVDSSHPEQGERLPQVVVEASAALPSPVFMKASAALGVMRWGLRADAHVADGEPQNLTELLLPRSVTGLLTEMDAIDTFAAQTAATSDLGDRPVVVLTAGQVAEGIRQAFDEAVLEETHAVWLELQGELAALSTNSDHRVIERASHYIHQQAPEAVRTAIADVVMAVRDDSPVRRVEKAATEH